MLSKERNSSLRKKKTWSDEVSLKLRGTMNRHKSVYWYPGAIKFRRFMRKRLLLGLFLTVWRGISSSGVTGSYRLEGIFIDPA